MNELRPQQGNAAGTHGVHRASSWRWTVVMAVLAVLLLGLRWALCFRDPHFKYGDERVYLELARNLVQHHSYRLDCELVPRSAWDNDRPPGEGWAGFATREAPGLSFSLAAVGQVIRPSPLMAKLTNGVVGWITILLYALAAYRLTQSRWVALAVMVATGLHPSFLYLNTTNYPQTFQACGLALIILFLVHVRRSLTEAPLAVREGGVVGGLLGLSALYVPSQLFLLPALSLAAWPLPWRRWLAYSLALGIGFGLALVPWILRNTIAEKAFIPFSTMGGEAMYLGFNEQAGANCYAPDAPSASDAPRIDQLPTPSRSDSPPTSGKEREARYRAHATAWIKANPRVAAQLWAAKAANYFRWDVGLMHTREEGAAPLRVWVSRLTTLLVYLIFLLGCWLGRHGDRYWTRLAGWGMFFLACGHAFFISRYRYRLPVEPLLLFVGLTQLGAYLLRQQNALPRPVELTKPPKKPMQ
jgi:hypothetical protein